MTAVVCQYACNSDILTRHLKRSDIKLCGFAIKYPLRGKMINSFIHEMLNVVIFKFFTIQCKNMNE